MGELPVFELVAFLDGSIDSKLNKITAIDAFEDNLFIGTSEGYVLKYKVEVEKINVKTKFELKKNFTIWS